MLGTGADVVKGCDAETRDREEIADPEVAGERHKLLCRRSESNRSVLSCRGSSEESGLGDDRPAAVEIRVNPEPTIGVNRDDLSDYNGRELGFGGASVGSGHYRGRGVNARRLAPVHESQE